MTKYRFGDIVREVKEKVDRSNNPYEYFIAGDHMDTDELHLLRRGSFKDSDVGPAFIRIFRPGQVLYGSRRTYLRKVAVANFEGVTANTTFVLESKDESVLLQRLLPFIMQSDRFVQHSIKRSKGSTNPYVLFTDLADYEINLPNVEKQKELADLLWTLDDVKMSYKRLISATNDLVKSQFIEMFGNISSGKYKYPTKKLGDVADVKSSHRIFTKEFVDSGVPFYRGTEIGQLAKGQIPTDLYYISNERYKEIASDDSKPQKGDLLMPSICDKGQVWLVDTDEPFYYKDGRVLCISPNRSTCNSKFLQYFMKQKTEIEYPKLGPGSTFAEFKIFLLKDMDILIPPITEQQNFASFVEQSDKSKFELKKALSELTATYKRIIKENIG